MNVCCLLVLPAASEAFPNNEIRNPKQISLVGRCSVLAAYKPNLLSAAYCPLKLLCCWTRPPRFLLVLRNLLLLFFEDLDDFDVLDDGSC